MLANPHKNFEKSGRAFDLDECSAPGREEQKDRASKDYQSGENEV